MRADSTAWYAAHAAQITLGLVFLLAAVPKMRQPESLVQTIVGYRLLPATVAPLAAWALLAIESFLAVALVTGQLTTVAIPLAAATLLGFLVVVVLSLRRGRRGIRCGCFGRADEVLSTRTVVRLVLLAAVAVGLLVLNLAAGTRPLAITEVLGGWSGLTYGLYIAMLAGSALLLSAWLLSLSTVISTLRGLVGPDRAHRPDTNE